MDGNNDVALVQELNAQAFRYFEILKDLYTTMSEARNAALDAKLDAIKTQMDRIESTLLSASSQADRDAATAATKTLKDNTQALASVIP